MGLPKDVLVDATLTPSPKDDVLVVTAAAVVKVGTGASFTLQVYTFFMPLNLENQRRCSPSLSTEMSMVAPTMRVVQQGRLITVIFLIPTPAGYPNTSQGFQSGERLLYAVWQYPVSLPPSANSWQLATPTSVRVGVRVRVRVTSLGLGYHG